MMKRIALGEWRCERATSPGIRTCTAAISVLVVAHWSFRPGLKSCIARRSSPTGTAVHDSSTTRSSSDHFHRSEEHTSELQSLAYLVCRLLLEKKKKPMRGMTSASSCYVREFPSTLLCP